jgi:hypothetical protein
MSDNWRQTPAGLSVGVRYRVVVEATEATEDTEAVEGRSFTATLQSYAYDLGKPPTYHWLNNGTTTGHPGIDGANWTSEKAT